MALETSIEQIGLVIQISSEKMDIYILKKERITLNLKYVRLEDKIIVGDWISVFFTEIGYDEAQYVLRKPLPNIALKLPKITHIDSKAIGINIDFIPLEQFLHPLSAVKKNLRMCHTELGNIPLVFANNFEPYCSYAGFAQILLNKNEVELRLEKTYKTPWLIAKSDYKFSQEKAIDSNLRKGNGLIIQRQGNFLLALSQRLGIVYLSAIQTNLDVGHFVGFYVAEVIEDGLPKRLALASRKLSFPYPIAKNSHGTVDIIHEVKVHDGPVGYKNSYYVEMVGDVRDVHALIKDNTNSNSSSTIKVRSQCVIDVMGANFHIVEILDKLDKNENENSAHIEGDTASAFVGKSHSAYKTPLDPPIFSSEKKPSAVCVDSFISEGFVFAQKSADSVLVYTNDKIVFRCNVTEFTTNDIVPLPKVGETLEIIQHSVGPPRSRKYVLDLVKRSVDCPYQTRVVNGILEVRIPVTVSDNQQATFYHNFFGVILNPGNRLDLLNYGVHCKKLKVWVRKYDDIQGVDWVFVDNPDPEIEAPPPIMPVLTSEPLKVLDFQNQLDLSKGLKSQQTGSSKRQPSTALRYIGAKYKSRPSISKMAPNHAQPQAKSTSPRNVTPSPSGGSSASKVNRQCSPRSSIDRRQLAEGTTNLDIISREHCNVYFPERFTPNSKNTPISILECQKSKQREHERVQLPSSQSPRSVPRKSSDGQLAEFEKGTEEEKFIALYKMDGVATSECNFGVFIYTNSNPDKEAFLPRDIMDVEIKHGDWINFEARWKGHKYMVVSYVKRPPIHKTTKVRNTVKLLINDAFVPAVFGNINDVHALMLTSSFLTVITDSNKLVSNDMRGRTLRIVALRQKASDANFRQKTADQNATSTNTVEWQVAEVLGVVG